MILAAIIATLVVVLQIITLSLLRSTRKMVREFAEKKPVSSFQNERRDREVRQNNKRPATENKNRPQIANNANNANAVVDPVEKSLRDINLKLKNAERDQEFARKKIQDNFSKDPNRRRDGGRGGRGDQRRNDRRTNWNDKNPRRDNPRTTIDSQINDENEEIKKPIEQPIQEVSEITSVAPELVPNDFGTDENLQHGRKFAPKRKFLPDENTVGSTEPAQDQYTQENLESTEKSVDSEIKFGRR
jgi:hypothetical protein